MFEERIKAALLAHAEGHIKKHVMNVRFYFETPAAIGDHPDIMEAIEKELKIIAEYHDQIEVINKYFS